MIQGLIKLQMQGLVKAQLKILPRLCSEVPASAAVMCISAHDLQTSSQHLAKHPGIPKNIPRGPHNWYKYNDVIYPPTEEGETERPAEICHGRANIKYSTQKLWYLALMIRGKTIDEALKQLSFHKRKGATAIKEVLLEAQEMAVNEFNVEYKSNLWISDSNVGRGLILKGARKHRGPRYGVVHYRYTHYMVRLREGPPPLHYYAPPETGWQKLEQHLSDKRARRIHRSL